MIVTFIVVLLSNLGYSETTLYINETMINETMIKISQHTYHELIDINV